MSKKAREIQLSLAGNIGDVYALISSARREQLMFDALVWAVLGMDEVPGMAGKPLVVLAHSEGSALAYRAFNNDAGVQAAIGGRPVTLVTYGEAIIPVLVFERRLRDAKPAWLRLQGFAGLLGLLLFAFTLGRVAADAIDAVSRTTAAVSFGLVVGRSSPPNARSGGAVAARPPGGGQEGRKGRERGRSRARAWTTRAADDRVTVRSGFEKPAAEAETPPPPNSTEVCLGLRAPESSHLRWVDLWAPWDPVPNGPLSVACPCVPAPCSPAALSLPGTADEFVSCRVSNLHQPWRDHVVYRDNPEDVVSRWVGEIVARANDVPPARPERPGLTPPGNANRARELRGARGVRVLAEQSVSAILGMFAIIWHWGEMDELGRIAAHRLPFLPSLLGKVTDFVPEGSPGLGVRRAPGLLPPAGADRRGGPRGRPHVGPRGLHTARQSSATGRYLAGASDEDLTGTGWTVAAGVLGLVVLVAYALVIQTT